MVERTTDGVERYVLVALVFNQKVNLVTFAVDYVYEAASEQAGRVFVDDIRPKGFRSWNDA
jgi:hypothetical protein